MIWMRHPLGQPFTLPLTTIAPLDGVAVAARGRSPDGALWPMLASITDSAAGTILIDASAVGRVWPEGVVWLDLRLSRADKVVHSQTLGLIVMGEAALAEADRRAAAPVAGLDQRRVWTTEGEVLDALCRRELGAERHVGTVLDLNPGLAAFGPVMPAGVGVILPVTPATASGAVATPLRLWGAGA